MGTFSSDEKSRRGLGHAISGGAEMYFRFLCCVLLRVEDYLFGEFYSAG